MPIMTQAAAIVAVYACQAVETAAVWARAAAGVAARTSRTAVIELVLKKTHLFAELSGFDRGLAEEALELATGLRRMPGEMIVHVHERLAALLGIWPEDARPGFQVARAIDLDARVVDDALIDTHEADVCEVRRW